MIKKMEEFKSRYRWDFLSPDSISEVEISLYFQLFYSSFNIGFRLSISIGAISACYVFYSILLPVLIQYIFKYIGVSCLHNTVWETVPVGCNLKAKGIVT